MQRVTEPIESQAYYDYFIKLKSLIDVNSNLAGTIDVFLENYPTASSAEQLARSICEKLSTAEMELLTGVKTNEIARLATINPGIRRWHAYMSQSPRGPRVMALLPSYMGCTADFTGHDIELLLRRVLLQIARDMLIARENALARLRATQPPDHDENDDSLATDVNPRSLQ